MIILDWRHARMILAFLAGVVVSALKISLPLMKYEGTWHGPFWAIFDATPVVVYVLCLLVLLPKVEYIAMVADMRTEVEQVIELTDKVKELRTEVETFAKRGNELTDLWLQGTLPRLQLLGQICSHIRNTNSEDLLPQLTLANQRLGSLEGWWGGVPGYRAAVQRGGLPLSSRINSILRSKSGEGMELTFLENGPLEMLVNKIDEQFSKDFAESGRTPQDVACGSEGQSTLETSTARPQHQSALLRSFDNWPARCQPPARTPLVRNSSSQSRSHPPNVSLLENASRSTLP